ncbi:MAG TPA: chemotaxis protein [Nitrospiraceae bacterium]|nr:MAG: chemotaxis protein [Nitrospirae bacterium GWA2_46_11]OGW22976.1 MAG: chemotaxis protein [Nitrospirae bacterium GWB2_47_37]HAK87951.1 chemotaxis protein [Nitrospiraceae bacterium]HCL81164.1 chemotaxis protein [Nitrospiraceae bacterium]HCZ10847.1 chemotaxis protein [Nitrospiraceae bacterium]
MTPVMTDDIFKQLRDFIYERSGIFIPDNKKYFIENRLGRKVQEKNLKGYEDYLYIIKYGSDKNELNGLFNLITTNETFFFREPQQFDVFSGELFKRITDENVKAGRKEIRIWSAASSTGEEPYTLAMILLEKPEAQPLRKEIYASDISEAVLSSARAGVYGSYSIRNVPEAYLKKYFNNSNQQYSLTPNIKSLTKFMKVNLMDDKDTKAIRGVDVIFCRNVLIYFDDKAKQKAVSNLYDALRPNGYLFIGTSESLHNVTRAFKPVVINKVIVYQKV